MRRLYVGGLSHSVTQKDLKDRFGKFGDVHDVELRTRKDEEGVPYKTFSYINIDISEADLKKCMTVLNKSKWKGGTLQIEAAKESFLHRLAQERQAAMEQCLQQPAAEDKRQKLLDSLSKAGVDNFTMKAAVPGTEVPGHKDWVVSKFGRVLPTLQLRCKKGNKARTLKYDPSKYSHNIRKLDKTTTDSSTPVTQLTWEVQGGDDDISKKRRGEFPPYKPPPRPKKSRTDMISSHNAVSRARLEPTVKSINHTEKQPFTNGFELHSKHRPDLRKFASLIDSDDSDEEIRRMVAAQNTSHDARYQEVEDNLEVVGFDYLGKLERSCKKQKGRPDNEDEDDYDSADTDELFASKIVPPPPPPPPSETPLKKKQVLPTDKPHSENNTHGKKKTRKQSKVGAEEAEEEDLRKRSCTQQRRDSGKQNSQKQSGSSGKHSEKTAVHSSSSESDHDEVDENEELDSADSSSDSDYDTMFSNVTRLEISFTDLQRLAEQSQPTSEPAVTSNVSPGPEKETGLIAGSAKQPTKKGIMPEEILASIMEDDSSDDDKKKKKKRKRKDVMLIQLPAFLGTNTLNHGFETIDNNQRLKEEENEEAKISVIKKHKLDSEAPQVDNTSSEEEEEVEVEDNPAAKMVPNKAHINTENAETSSSSSSDDDEEEVETSSSSSEEDKDKVITVEDVGKLATPAALHSESISDEDEEDEEEEKAPSRVTLGAKEEAELQRKANMRRLAAIQQRQKEAEEHKRLIQGALANLDTPNPGTGKRIVFGSDDEEEQDGEDESKQQISPEVTVSKKTMFHDSQSEDEATGDEESADENNTVKENVQRKRSASRLFGGSDDEEDGDGEEDDSRFDIRPQFEGRAGQKLMELQSRFGTDERFRMDSRFLEDDEGKEEESERTKNMADEDETLEEERKKNLSILQSVLGSVQQTCSSKTTVKAKTFRDVSALHYDPSREEHAAFETKPEETKESKSARRKKREEAQKLPEVTKEIYYDVSGDLKAVFGQTKDNVTEEEENPSWDQEEEEKRGNNEEPILPVIHVPADLSAEKQESGFKFSFFGEDAETETRETEYKVETIQAPKVSWQQDPRFQDSSSEEDDDEEGQEEDEEQSSATPKTTEEATPSKTSLFFFFPEDSRLTEGPRLFCRPSQLEEQREQWEERRSELRQEYRKKHKDARRKLKASLKS
ncbi:hypothetical protein JOB18_034210 [Solea senegalensis]|uniref:Nucleolar protein 8 n=1 Tax=Solea senegalensis TaxID=28829 RepID=A0AAV6QR59_SOLSE|nr:nucleolar protein 8 [Solea senegalensis]XP_043879898.1 nucleolar protein 8 [Solea senegalensis]XP_043879899.1 nucleolar protein 8 [Solea senegalensis]XP_043879901.1 nucleolar protein 8 [Solea senegalensis]KAG7494610.1 nucleolar 8 [Solea senegalensis]KAG7494611.1 hypothetical protein JOB18_034210 [Solea senegalensis]KAG7494612.1 hypothetical protein JOB18_034210 [Solea senegalensis]KAG7494613.1 hypothetical protein JOB18_034210 [Solea senegalensis]KAG7494614.1 hypothetical protein JOB18_0